MPPEGVELLVLTAVALAFAVVFTPPTARRSVLLVRGGVGLAGTAVIVTVPTFDLALLVVLVLGALQAMIDGKRPVAVRLRAPVLAVGLLALAVVLAQVQGPQVLQRFAAVGLVAGLAAAVGLLPYIHPFDPEEPLTASPIAWAGFIGPVLAAVVVARAQGLLPP